MQTGLVLEYRRLRAREDRAAALEAAEATSTALLRAVSHDLRTPLATMRAVGRRAGLRPRPGAGRPGSPGRRPLDGSTDQLESLIDNLLDLSRLQSGLLKPQLRARSLDEVLPLAVAGSPAGAVSLEVDESAPMVRTDAGLLERVVANLVGNAVRVSARQAGAGARPRPPGDRRDHGRRPRPRRTARPAGADVRAVPAARRHLAGRPGARPGGGPRARPRPSAARSRPRTPPAAG